MYETKTVDNIQADLLANVSDTYEKSIGYPVYDILRSVAIANADIYLSLKELYDMEDVDNLTGDKLTKFVLQRKGIVRKIATYAKVTLTITGNGTINLGDLFSTSTNLQFKSLETKIISDTGTISAQAIVAGTIGNVPAGTITQMPITLAGISGVTNNAQGYDGYEEEDDDSLRSRYYDAIKKPITGSNKYSYISWAKSMNGVGNAICYSLWNGDNTVKVVIIDENNLPVSADTVTNVQNYIDPKGDYDEATNTWSSWGSGAGEAGCGAYCTVESAVGKTIDIQVKISKSSSNYTDDEIIENIKTSLTAYLSSIALDFKSNYVSFAKIGQIILNTEGVLDYDSSTLQINNTQSNVVLSLTPELTEVPVTGSVTLL